jgi:hypothetical protein
MDKALDTANKLLDGSLSCGTCPALSELVERVRNKELEKSEFVNIIRANLQEQKLNKVV